MRRWFQHDVFHEAMRCERLAVEVGGGTRIQRQPWCSRTDSVELPHRSRRQVYKCIMFVTSCYSTCLCIGAPGMLPAS